MGSSIVIMQNQHTDSCLLSSLSNNIKDPKQTVRALIEARDSNAIDSINSDLHEENRDHSFHKTFLLNDDHFFTSNVFSLLFAFTIIMMKQS